MENPFETINQKLDRITTQLNEIASHLALSGTEPAKRILSINDASKLLGMARQTIYGYTMLRNIPHYKNGKKLYFLEDELLTWALSNKVKTHVEIANEPRQHRFKRE
jgi:predicted DNA-binding transcriptional regulator AlpA